MPHQKRAEHCRWFLANEHACILFTCWAGWTDDDMPQKEIHECSPSERAVYSTQVGACMCRRSGTTRSSAGCSTCSRLPASSASWSSPAGWWWTRHKALTKCMFVRVDKLSGVHLLCQAVAECVACKLSPPACPCRGSAAQGLHAIPQKAGGGPDCCLMLLVETSCDRLEEFNKWSESTHVSLPACQSGAASWAFQIFPQTGSSLWQQLVLANGVSTRSGPS